MALSDFRGPLAIAIPGVPALVDCAKFQNRLRLIALENRLRACRDKIALKSFAKLLEARRRPKPRAATAMYRHQLLAVEVEGLYLRRVDEGARKIGLRKSIIHDVEHRRQVSERTIRTALARYGSEAHSALRMYFP